MPSVEMFAIPLKVDGKGDRGQDWLDEEPERAENGLLVHGHEVAADEHRDQVAVAPKVGQVQVEPARFGAITKSQAGSGSEAGGRCNMVFVLDRVKSGCCLSGNHRRNGQTLKPNELS